MASLDTQRLNETFDLLSHPHRRYALYHLTEETGDVSVESLAAAVARWDGGHPETDRRGGAETIETALRHVHLPKLSDAGIVALDPDAGTVELGETDGFHEFLGETARIDGYSGPAADD